MAGNGNAVEALCEETTCPICLDYFQDPVILTECGHNFCRACLDQSWDKSGAETSCPQCRRAVQRGNLLPNRQLANCVEIAKKLRGGRGAEAGQGGESAACEKHREPLKLFCQEDEAPICVVCDRAREHRGHQVVPLEEAAEEYESLVNIELDLLQRKREKIEADKADVEKESQHLLEVIETERQETVALFQKIRQFLEEQEKLLLSQMDEVEKETTRQRDEQIALLSGKITYVESQIQELEEKRQLPANEFLKDIRRLLQRNEEKVETLANPMVFSPELKWQIWDFCDINPFFDGVMEKFKRALLHGQQLEKANVTLDPDTAHPQLILSEDCKSVRWGDKPQSLPKNPERFDVRAFVLGWEEFTVGRHFWEVHVKGKGIWAVGVVRKSVRRKGPVPFSPEEGIWAVGKWNGRYRSINPPENSPLHLRREPTRVRVTLNFAGERVAFFDADTGDFLYAFSKTSLSGEILHPYFYVIREGQLTISP